MYTTTMYIYVLWTENIQQCTYMCSILWTENIQQCTYMCCKQRIYNNVHIQYVLKQRIYNNVHICIVNREYTTMYIYVF